MIITTPWGAVAGGVRVRLSTSRVVHILDRIPGRPDLVLMRSSGGATRLASVDPRATAQVLIEAPELAVIALRRHFPRIEYLREER